MERRKYIKLVAKLSAINIENGSTENEVLIAAEQMRKIKTQYGITLEDLQNEENEIEKHIINLEYKRVPKYLQFLLGELQRCFDCKIVRLAERGAAKYSICGYEKDVIMLKHFYIYLSRILINLSRGKTNKNAYCLGIIQKIGERLRPENKNQGNGNSIIIIKKKNIEKFIKKEYPKLQKAQKTSINIGDGAFEAGLKMGNKISLRSPVSTKTTGTLRLQLRNMI